VSNFIQEELKELKEAQVLNNHRLKRRLEIVEQVRKMPEKKVWGIIGYKGDYEK